MVQSPTNFERGSYGSKPKFWRFQVTISGHSRRTGRLPGAGYIQRTRSDVLDSDATLSIMCGRATGGTARTIAFRGQCRKTHLVIDAEVTPIEEAARQVVAFVQGRGVRRLYVAGPRANGELKGYDYEYRTIQILVATLFQS